MADRSLPSGRPFAGPGGPPRRRGSFRSVSGYGTVYNLTRTPTIPLGPGVWNPFTGSNRDENTFHAFT